MRIIICVVFLFFISCVDNSNKNQAMDHYVDQEIKDRIEKIKKFSKEHDTVFIDPERIDKKFKELLLMSTDVENIAASVNSGNNYFNELSESYKLNATDFATLNISMPANDIASVLKQNEMIFFNHILLNNDHKALELHSAR